ncbi:MAG TPA: hypothetical protein VF094_06630 [Gaiellaceae bacterium]
MKALLAAAVAACACGLLAAGCSSDSSKSAAAAPAKTPKLVCSNRTAWQSLANRIKAPVYCPGWLPDPLIGAIGNKWNNINVVSRDRSYLESFVWQETGGGAAGGELHVNLRGYPGVTRIPTCRTGGSESVNVPCFADPHGTYTARGITTTLYTVNQDADEWHALLLWRRFGNLYTLSEHVAPPLTFDHVVRYLHQELRSLVLVRPTSAT